MRKRRNKGDGEDVARAIIEDGAAYAAQGVRDSYDFAVAKCESPIEKILLAQFLHPLTGQEWDTKTDVLLPPSGAIEHVAPPPIEGFWLWPQIKIGPYRVDFVVASSRAGRDPEFAIIECDGHDFHEKTKEQAQRDKARDRYLTGRGFRILRYTGSEVYRNPAAVWEEILMMLLGLCDD